ncbi:unnamed protein product [Arabidopsis thaliana]|uniref:NYN domain-containing protein n=1 Tax=Arabidopsis thaliana TaxID=3702 RepID=A0A5S9WNZ7_ARATH|nr:unnamed protein product [Arabidopsis thaliana]
MVDIVCWAVKNGSACRNLLLIANASSEDHQFWPFLQGLRYRGFKLFATIPDRTLPDDECLTAVMCAKYIVSWKHLSLCKGIEDTGSDD